MHKTPIRRTHTLVALIALPLSMIQSAACKPETDHRESKATPVATKSPAEPTPHPTSKRESSSLSNERNIATASGEFVIFYRIDTPVSAPPLNEMFAMAARVEDADGRPLGSDDITLRVDAAMPQHGHGMNTTPRTEPADDGFHVSGMLFHMPGDWQIYFDVTRGGTTDRATVDVTLD